MGHLCCANSRVLAFADESKCVKGAKQFMVWNQREGNNLKIDRNRVQKDGMHRFAGECSWRVCHSTGTDTESSGYNMKMGFKNGAQNDIFELGSSAYSTTASTLQSESAQDETPTQTLEPPEESPYEADAPSATGTASPHVQTITQVATKTVVQTITASVTVTHTQVVETQVCVCLANELLLSARC